MKPLKFPEANMVFAEKQKEYLPLPAHMDKEFSIATFCWQLSFKERLTVLFTGKIWHRVMTFYKNLQPQLLTVKKPDLWEGKENENSSHI